MSINLIDSNCLTYCKIEPVDKFKLPWRNWLARSAVNRKVGGSSPPGSVFSYSYTLNARILAGWCNNWLLESQKICKILMLEEFQIFFKNSYFSWINVDPYRSLLP